jgi:hypothetical protein
VGGGVGVAGGEEEVGGGAVAVGAHGERFGSVEQIKGQCAARPPARGQVSHACGVFLWGQVGVSSSLFFGACYPTAIGGFILCTTLASTHMLLLGECMTGDLCRLSRPHRKVGKPSRAEKDNRELSGNMIRAFGLRHATEWDHTKEKHGSSFLFLREHGSSYPALVAYVTGATLEGSVSHGPAFYIRSIPTLVSSKKEKRFLLCFIYFFLPNTSCFMSDHYD